MPQRPMDDLFTGLHFWTDGLETELVSAASARREEIIPFLMTQLEIILANPEEYADREDHSLLAYALVLLSHLDREQAHQVLLRLYHLPGDVLDTLTGDFKKIGMLSLLLHTCGIPVDGSGSLALNLDQDVFIRCAALETLALADAAERTEPREMILFLGGLLSGAETPTDAAFWDGIAGRLYDLYPDQVMDVIRNAYGDGLFSRDVDNPEETGLSQDIARPKRDTRKIAKARHKTKLAKASRRKNR